MCRVQCAALFRLGIRRSQRSPSPGRGNISAMEIFGPPQCRGLWRSQTLPSRCGPIVFRVAHPASPACLGNALGSSGSGSVRPVRRPSFSHPAEVCCLPAALSVFPRPVVGSSVPKLSVSSESATQKSLCLICGAATPAATDRRPRRHIPLLPS